MTARDLDVEAQRRELRGLLSRRVFVAAGLGASLGALGLTGCGSDSPGGPGGGTPPPPPPPPTGLLAVTGSVSLPSGSSLKLGSTTLGVMAQDVPVSASGAFSVSISPSAPSLAMLADGDGNGVLLSIFDPARGSQAVSAHSTAVAMLYFATGAYALPVGSMSAVLTLIDTDPAVAALESVVARAVAADPHALANNASTLQPAIMTALQSMLGQHATRIEPAHALDPVPTLMLVTPTDEQNGLLVSQDPSSNTGVIVTNNKRRPCKVYVYETSTLTGQVTTDVSPAKLVQGPFALDSTQSMGVFHVLEDFFTGTSPFAPVTLPSIPLQLETGTDRTTCQVIVLTSSFKALGGDAFEPAFFRDPHYVNEVDAWRSAEQLLIATSVFGDILFPVICFLLGAGGITASRATIVGVIAAAAAAKSTTFTAVMNSFLEVDDAKGITQGLVDVVRNAFTSDLSTQFWKPSVQQFVGPAEAEALAAESTALTSSRALARAKTFLGVFQPLFIAGIVLDTWDLGAVLLDVFNSDVASSWNALLIRQLLNLKPQNPSASPGDRVTFNVTPPAGVTGTFVYDWSQNSVFATFSAVDEANVGNAITTSDLTVDLITTGSDTKPISVMVIGYDTSSGQRVEIGRAGTTVTMLLPAQITPSAPALLSGEQKTFTVAVTGDLPSDVRYKWTLTGTGGHIGDTNVSITNTPAITYTADTGGQTDRLHVDVINVGNVVLAKADVSIAVVGSAFINFTIAGPWDAQKQPPNGQYVYTDGTGSRQAAPGEQQYQAVAFAYDLAGNNPGVALYLVVSPGAPLHEQQTFTKVPPGATSYVPGQFIISIAKNLANPNDPNSSDYSPAATGTLKIDQLAQLSDGKNVAFYSFLITNPGGGSIQGNGQGQWI